MYFLDKRLNNNKLFRNTNGLYENYNYYFILLPPNVNIWDSKVSYSYKDKNYNMIIYHQDRYVNKQELANNVFNKFANDILDSQERTNWRVGQFKEELLTKIEPI